VTSCPFQGFRPRWMQAARFPALLVASLFVSVVWLAAAAVDCRADVKVAIDQKLAQDIDPLVRAEMQEHMLVGCAVGLVREGRVVFLKGYGLADRDRRTPVTTQTMFRWASISKPITAVAALQLWQNKKLDLDADVRQYVPEFPDKKVKITVRDLLCHQSGIVHYENGPVVRTQREYDRPHPFADVVVALDTFKDSPLVCRPREKFSYSTHGYMLVGAAVERAGGEEFAAQVAKRIARPLGMSTFQPDYQWVDVPNRAVGYRMLLGNVLRSTNTDVSWKLGGGGFISSVEDLARFCAGLMQGSLVNRETQQLMWTAQRTESGKITPYGLGFRLEGKGRTRRVSHSGSQEKTKTIMVFCPDLKAGAVVMCNCEYAEPKRLADKLLPVAAPQLKAGPDRATPKSAPRSKAAAPATQ
jgi:CubicO group peptidase (beta-lactamase class C family)